MKIAKQLTYILIFVFSINASAQKNDPIDKWEKQILRSKAISKKEFKKNIIKYDFGSLWTDTDNSAVYGFIGQNYQRIRVKIISAAKDKNNPDTYAVSGKSMIKSNICSFSGSIKIIKARTYKKMYWGVDDEFKNNGVQKQGIITADYNFSEKCCIFSGIFEGRLVTKWYIDKNGELKYDDIEKESDSYGNNQFAGTWKSYKGEIVKIANWGDYRIPLSGDLDGGAGEFSPIDKYLQFGWQNYREAYVNNNEQARLDEEREWWK